MRVLIIGRGFIGRRCAEAWPESVLSDKRIYTKWDAVALLEEHKPDAVLNAAGVTGKPNVDWCESHQEETLFGNVVLPLFIAEACARFGIYLLHLGSGCIFYGKSPYGTAWKEDDYANPAAVYTKSKYAADLALSTMPNIGIVRLRMPIDYIPHPANLIDKLAGYKKIVDVTNSVTVMEDLINVLRQLIRKQGGGIFHAVNPGAVSHREIMRLYKKFVDPHHENEWIIEDDLVRLGMAVKKRSNNVMDSKNLENLGIRMRHIKEALEDTMRKYAEIKKC